MTNLPRPACTPGVSETKITAGLNVPADSHVVPWGEMMGVSNARHQAPKGRSIVGVAKASEAASTKTDRKSFDFMEGVPGRRFDGHTKMRGGLEERKKSRFLAPLGMTVSGGSLQKSERRAQQCCAPTKSGTLLRWFKIFRRVELHGAEDAFAFFEEDDL